MAQNIITINRGDTYDFDVTIEDESTTTQTYVLQPGDCLYFGLMLPHQPFEDAVLKKRFSYADLQKSSLSARFSGRCKFIIEHKDTLNLLPGVYYYSVKLFKASASFDETKNEIITIINKTKFIIND